VRCPRPLCSPPDPSLPGTIHLMTTDLRGFYATYGGECRYAKEDKDVDVQLLLSNRSVRETSVRVPGTYRLRGPLGS